MKAEDCFELGIITRPHGLSGEVQISLDTETPESYQELESVYVEINNKLIPFFIESLSISGKKAIVRFDDVNSQQEAAAFSGKKVFLPMEFLPALEEDQYYYHEINGFLIVDKSKGNLGVVDSVVENPGHDLIIMEYLSREVLIPITDDIVLLVDRNSKTIQVDLPAGLLELFLED